MNNSGQNKRGMILIFILACLAIASALLLTGVKLAVSSHRVARSFAWSAQCEWLAESGLDRAAVQLAIDANYIGETWKIPAEKIDGINAGIVRIEVKPVADQSDRRLVLVVADFPDDPQYRVRYSKELSMELL